MKSVLTLLTVMLLAPVAAIHAAEPAKPNVVILLADDLGWGDLGTNQGTIPTPNVDRLFSQGVRLDNFMGWCVCSPTRAMLLTGRHPFRVGTGPETGGELAAAETCIAEAFQSHGYATGVFGKWHNGEDPDTSEYRAAFAEAFKDKPNKKLVGGLGANAHGFDEAWVYYGGGADYFTRRGVGGRGPVSWWHNREYRPNDAGYTEDLIVGRALEFIRQNKGRPFFCYVPFHLVHSPLQAKDPDLAAVDAKITDGTKRRYAAMVQAMDKNVGAVLGELDSLGLRNNTIVVFSSDNGATLDGSNLPLRGGKHTLYEGGIRLPTAIHWPEGGLCGGKRWSGLAGFMDLFPTLIDMAGLPMPPTRPLDGKNLWPALQAGGPSPVETYYWAWHNCDAIRTADWKLLRFFAHDELYDIRNDPGESTNVAASNPDTVKLLRQKMAVWTSSLGAALTHQAAPASLDAPPSPEGEVLEITVTVTNEAKPRDRLLVPFASSDSQVFATDYVEYDLAVAPGSLPSGFFYSPFKGNDTKDIRIDFKPGEGIDQFGRQQSQGPAPRGGAGVWEHRAVGLCGMAPHVLSRHGIVFTGAKPGTFKIYLDNLRVRRADGKTTLIWAGAANTRARKTPDSKEFQNVQVRTIALQTTIRTDDKQK